MLRFPPLLLCVLAGGRSRRFGRSKLFVNIAGKPILTHLATRTQPLKPIAKWLSIAPLAITNPPPGAAAFDRRYVDPSPYAGPLAAVASILAYAQRRFSSPPAHGSPEHRVPCPRPRGHVFAAAAHNTPPLVAILAADMPFASAEYILKLAHALHRLPHHAAIMGRWIDGPRANRTEPLPSVWRLNAGTQLATHAAQYTTGRLHALAAHNTVAALPLTYHNDHPNFLNINHPQDMRHVSTLTNI